MEDIYDKNKKCKSRFIYLMYEFIGTMIITIGYNFSTFDALNYEFYFIASLLAWENSCAHFNMGTTIACLVYEIDTFDTK